ncbi:hypothetical protein IY145_21180 [Methylosinus sp. H3A]|uniref:hypothetical protein n=1 Tax=Methylosinus sp. H3A TaxID=2785786 RepID=UPI0018C2DA31|nr:hypothetical protein [Methylosinus sp. H3A]MBG0811866.1 hypothetical protein [Methylosinus sp. H3A]
MANYVVYAHKPHLRRADRRNAIFVQAADAAAAQAVAEALVGANPGALADWAVLDLASAPDFVVRGHEPTRGTSGEVL